MDLRNYGVIDFAEHVQLDGMYSAKNKALHEQVDSLNKQLKAVRAENQRYIAQHHDDQIEMHNLRVENEQLEHNKLLEDTVDEKNKMINDLEDQIESLEDEIDFLKNQTYEQAARANKRIRNIIALHNEIDSLKRQLEPFFMERHQLYKLIDAAENDDDMTIKIKANKWLLKNHPDKLPNNFTTWPEEKKTKHISNMSLVKNVMRGQNTYWEKGHEVNLLHEYKDEDDTWLQKFYKENPMDGDESNPRPIFNAPFAARAKTGIKQSRRTHDERTRRSLVKAK